MARQNRAELRVEIPAPGQDKPRLGRVGVIALVGFAVGVLWPRIAGVHLAPSAPVDDSEPAVAVADSAEPSASAAPAPAPAAAKVAEAPAGNGAQEAPTPQRVLVKESTITSCHDDQGRKQKTCDKIDFNAVLAARIQALATCQAAEGTKGVLSIGFELDFKSGKVKDAVLGKSTTIPDKTARELLGCAKKELAEASIEGVEHKLSSYTVFYVAEFLVPAAAAPGEPAGAAADVATASGHATVSWEAAIIRETPKDGKILARVLRGTRVVVTGKNGDWYRIKYDAKGSEGWVYRSAIGL